MQLETVRSLPGSHASFTPTLVAPSMAIGHEYAKETLPVNGFLGASLGFFSISLQQLGNASQVGRSQQNSLL